MHPIQNEPVLTAITALLAAAAGLLAAFGVHLTDMQVSALVQFVEAAYLAGFLLRSQVTPKARLARVTSTDASGHKVIQPPVPGLNAGDIVA